MLFVDRASIHADRKCHIFNDIQYRNQIIELINQPDLPSAEDGKLFLLLCVDISALHIDFAGGWCIDTA